MKRVIVVTLRYQHRQFVLLGDGIDNGHGRAASTDGKRADLLHWRDVVAGHSRLDLDAGGP
jgi:hypothetical protein